MDFTQYSQLLSYIQDISSQSILDIQGFALDSNAQTILNIPESDSELAQLNRCYDVILCRFATRLQIDPFVYLSEIAKRLNSGGYLILQDYVLPDDERVADYINGFIHIFDKKHVKSFARYAWDGLLLDVGLRIENCYQRPINSILQNWIDHYQPQEIDKQHAQVLLFQAPTAVRNIMQLQYQGTPYARFALQEIVCVAQKES